MSFTAFIFKMMSSRGDRKRNDAIAVPQGVVECRDLHYRCDCEHHLMDVYYPEGAQGLLPTIVSIHGGGYVYGNKEIYRLYCMDLARRGFAVVNFNYRLAPKWKYPAPLVDTNMVMQWICAQGEQYHLDPARIFIVGDSAGAQLASQYGAIWANEEYAARFSFQVPAIRILAMGLNCGMYDISDYAAAKPSGLVKDYIKGAKNIDPASFEVMQAIDSRYPPCHITSALGDFLKENAQPMCQLLLDRAVDSECQIYGSQDNKLGHVFHVNIILPEAVACNDSQCAFFRKYLHHE